MGYRNFLRIPLISDLINNHSQVTETGYFFSAISEKPYLKFVEYKPLDRLFQLFSEQRHQLDAWDDEQYSGLDLFHEIRIP